MRRKQEQTVLGFFKDKSGSTRPITKSAAELNRKKVVQKPKQFQGVNPNMEKQRRQIQGKIAELTRGINVYNQKLEQYGRDMEAMKNEYQQVVQQDPQKAVQIQRRMNKLLFVVTSLAKKRDMFQAKLKELKG